MRKLKDNIKIVLKRMWCDGANWVESALVNLRVSQKQGTFDQLIEYQLHKDSARWSKLQPFVISTRNIKYFPIYDGSEILIRTQSWTRITKLLHLLKCERTHS